MWVIRNLQQALRAGLFNISIASSALIQTNRWCGVLKLKKRFLQRFLIYKRSAPWSGILPVFRITVFIVSVVPTSGAAILILF